VLVSTLSAQGGEVSVCELLIMIELSEPVKGRYLNSPILFLPNNQPTPKKKPITRMI
jgi:hypothetical protein